MFSLLKNFQMKIKLKRKIILNLIEIDKKKFYQSYKNKIGIVKQKISLPLIYVSIKNQF